MPLTTVIPAADKTPGTFINVSLGVGPRSAGDQPIKVLVVGNKTSAGVTAVDTPTLITSEDDAITAWGTGSELHLMCAAALKAHPGLTLWAAAITAAGTAATLATIIVAGTT